jgi:hypothetical protein
VVVPEFSSTSTTFALIGALFGGMVIIQRFKRKRIFKIDGKRAP